MSAARIGGGTADGQPAPTRDKVTYGAHTIPFDVIRTDRATLGIHVYPSGDVEVRAPLDTAAKEVRACVHRRARWIVRHQQRFNEIVRAQPVKEYASGETHRYLGRQYRLRVQGVGEAESEGVRLVGRYFEVRTAQPVTPERTRELLDLWYRAKARFRLRERFATGCATMERYGVAAPPLQIRAMERRWGSCTPSGKVLLNPRLVLAPTACIDYVVVHELCHLRHPHHGRAFYGLLSRVMPDWRDRKARLEAVQ